MPKFKRKRCECGKTIFQTREEAHGIIGGMLTIDKHVDLLSIYRCPALKTGYHIGHDHKSTTHSRKRTMIRSREIALRCAASLPKRLLSHGYPQYRTTDQDNTLSNLGLYTRVSHEVAEQLTHCADDMAQRLILGTSK